MTAHLPAATLPAGYLLRRLRTGDTATTARLHRRLLPNGLFPGLGPRFMRHWHGTFLDTPAATGLAVVHHGEVVAFLLGSLDQRLYLHHTLRHHRRALMWRGALGLLARPHVLLRFLRTRVRTYARHLLPGTGATRRTADQGPPGGRDERRVRVAVVHAVATSEQARGLGCARALLDTFADAARRARADHVALVTDVEDPSTGAAATGAAAMYERLGWHREAVRRHRDGRWVAEYRLALHRPGSEPGTA
ncbi:GNAT family N-acetyltransferase [Aquipuribacter sp. MA13-6]|uniref:GNAT family N-acetyltransferase n=1 Tax=unclassified Aquipuribacter TaxID=2635084 RepID=UPI003EF07A05